MRIAIGSDHGGVDLKESIKKALDEKKISYADFGTDSKTAVDYPDVAVPVAKDVSGHKSDFGILLCRTGIGMSITANKIPGIRAALCDSPRLARLSRLHNNANVLTLAGDTPADKANDIVAAFLDTPFENEERHKRRVEKIHRLTGL
jgi:ribose 5-phosphate isomerase B